MKHKRCSLCGKFELMESDEDICQECSDDFNWEPDTGTSEDFK